VCALHANGGSATWRYGGNTPCLELVAPDGTQFILDCGQDCVALEHGGAFQLAARNPKLTFYDAIIIGYIQGIPFFMPLLCGEHCIPFLQFPIEVFGPRQPEAGFETQMAMPYFPVDMSAMSAKRKLWK